MSSTKSRPVSRPAILLNAIGIVLPVAIWNIIAMLPRIWMQKLPFKPALLNGAMRSALTHMPPQHIQAMSPSTLDTYKAWIQRVGSARGFQERVQPTDAGKTNILWLETAEKYEKVILFFHGGGYISPLSDGHLDLLAYMHGHLASQGVHVGMAVCEYALVPEHPYPAQLSQAIDALQTLINAGFKMENTIIGGDSAGGHLALSLLSHLNHPRTPDQWPRSAPGDDSTAATPKISVVEGSGRMPAAFLMSPLCSIDTTQTSFHTRGSVDMISPAVARTYRKQHHDATPAQSELDIGLGWSMALDMSPEAVAAWWRDLDTVVANVLITVGQEECFRDGCIKLGELLRDVERKGKDFKLDFLLQEGEAHDAPLFDFALGLPPSATTKSIVQFVFKAFNN